MLERARIGDWIQTYSGKVFYPLDPHEDEIDIIDISHSLSQICRFTGHCKRFISVAQHSVFVSSMCPNTHKLCGLLHDATEGFICDFSRPMKRAARFAPYLEVETNLLRVIYKKFGIPEEWAINMPDEVKEADNRTLITERDQLMSKPPMEWSDKYEPYDIKIDPWEPKKAEQEFLKLFYQLYKESK